MGPAVTMCYLSGGPWRCMLNNDKCETNSHGHGKVMPLIPFLYSTVEWVHVHMPSHSELVQFYIN